MNIKIESLPMAARAYEIFGLNFIKHMWWPYKEQFNGQAQPSLNMLTNQWDLRFDYLENSVSGTVQEKEMNKQTTFEKSYLPAALSYFAPINGLQVSAFLKGETLLPTKVVGQTYNCELVRDMVRTFNHQMIPARLDTCFHVMSGDYSKDYKFQVGI